eukprot:8631256-Alexandrium_andersonii.AAC.1
MWGGVQGVHHDGGSSRGRPCAWVHLMMVAAAARGMRFKEGSKCKGNIVGVRTSACTKSSR